MPDLMDAIIRVATIEEKTYQGDKGPIPYWKIIDGNGAEWSLWSRSLREHFKEGESYPIKYSLKGEFKRIEQIIGIETKQKGFGRPQRPLEEELQIQRIITGGGIAKSLIENACGEPMVGIPIFEQWMAAIMGQKIEKPHEVANKPPIKPIEAKKEPAQSMGKGIEGTPEAKLKTAIETINNLANDLRLTGRGMQQELEQFAFTKEWRNQNGIKTDGLRACSIEQLREFYKHLEALKP